MSDVPTPRPSDDASPLAERAAQSSLDVSPNASQFASVVLDATNEPERDAEARRMIDEMFAEHRERLLRMIELRLQPELRSRVDANDVLQEAFIEAYRQLRTGISAPKVSSLVWLRLIVNQQLVTFYRRYCQTQKRNVGREISISAPRMQADPTSTSIFLVGKLTSPSLAARRAELTLKLRECLEKLDPDDREILSLRHFEQLSNRETAEELNVAPNVASVRYLRALKKFRVVLQAEKLDELLE